MKVQSGISSTDPLGTVHETETLHHGGQPIIEKTCTKCNSTKEIGEFYVVRGSRGRKDAHLSRCKKCENERFKNRYRVNPKKYLSWKKNNPVKCRAYQSRYRENNLEKVRENLRNSNTKTRSTPRGQLNHNISAGIFKSLKNGKMGSRWESVVGYTIDQLKESIEKQFLPGMDWNNYGKHGWHVDHKTPIAVFNFEKPEDTDFKRCWSLKNLQPLWAIDNLKKHAKIERPFQPSLIFK